MRGAGLTSLRRFAEFDRGLFRSGKYSAGELKLALTHNAIRRVVDLRDNPRQLLASSTYAKLGVEYVRFPIDEHLGLPALNVLSLLVRGTLVHCWKGSHRTGAVVAAHRLHTGWTRSATWDEMQRFGFGEWRKHERLAESVFGAWRPC